MESADKRKALLKRFATLLGTIISHEQQEKPSKEQLEKQLHNDNGCHSKIGDSHHGTPCSSLIQKIQQNAQQALRSMLTNEETSSEDGVYRDDDDDDDAFVIGSFPSLLLAVGHGYKGNLQRLKETAIASLSCPILVLREERLDRNYSDGQGMDVADTGSGYLQSISEVPNELATNLCTTFTNLLHSRAKVYARILAQILEDSLAGSGGYDVTNVVLDLIWSRTFVETVVTSFHVLSSRDEACNALNSARDYTEDSTGRTSCAIRFEVTLDIFVFGIPRTVHIKSNGKLIGTFGENGLSRVKVEVDCSSLFESLKHEVMISVDNSLSTLLSGTHLSGTSSFSEEEKLAIEKIANLQRPELENVLDEVLSVAAKLSSEEKKTKSHKRGADHAEIMPPPLPRKPRVEGEGEDPQGMAMVSPDITSRSGCPLHEVPCLLSKMGKGRVSTGTHARN
mmetsp:Transcript_8853/g.11390  ORF Transcript_8853/g.11390 Transcript_8853/m.11390 type:complete len:452 (+) Transcript_8853:145-1500(+)